VGIIFSLQGADGESEPVIYPTEIQSTGTADEWVELTNAISEPVNLYDYALTTDGSGRAPSSYFGGYEDLSEFGIWGLLEDQNYYLNAENLYIDHSLTAGNGPYDQFYLYKANETNEYGTYYHVGLDIYNDNQNFQMWWDAENSVFLTEDEKDQLPLSELEDHIYQITLPEGWFCRYLYFSLDPDNDGKYEINQDLCDYNPGECKDMPPLIIDLRNMSANEESSSLEEILENGHGVEIRSSTLFGIYIKADLREDTFLDFRDDNDNTTVLASTHLPTSENFWKIRSLPNDGIFFVNDNHPETELYYSHVTGGRVEGPGEEVEIIQFSDSDLFHHFSNEDYFKDSVQDFGNITIDLTDETIRDQITVVEISGPILTDTIIVDKNNGNIRVGPGANTVEISIDLMEDDQAWLFPMGATYRDYTMNGAPSRNLHHLIAVTEDVDCDCEQQNNLIANGIIHVWNRKTGEYEGTGLGWGNNGPAPESVGGMSAQAYFDGTDYHFDLWTLGEESPGLDNSVPAPSYGTSDIVINEINPGFIELYNRGMQTVNLNGWKVTGEWSSYTLSGIVGSGEFFTFNPLIAFCGRCGGGPSQRISLFDPDGVLVNSIGFWQDVSGNVYSYAQRHIDGVGVDYGYNDYMTQPWIYGEEGAQRNADWDLGQTRSTNRSNYDSPTILQVGIEDGDYHLLDDIYQYNTYWRKGLYGVESLDEVFMAPWDIILVTTEMNENDLERLSEFVLRGGDGGGGFEEEGGGRLYIEQSDWTKLDGTGFCDVLGIKSREVFGTVPSLEGSGPIAKNMNMEYSGVVRSIIVPGVDTLPIWERGANTYAALYQHIDRSDPGNSYRVVASSLEYGDLMKAQDSDTEPYQYLGSMIDYFLQSDDEVNDVPVASIDTVSKYLIISGEEVTLKGHGIDDGRIIRYRWVSDIDGFLSNESSFSTSSLSLGTHTIHFTVFDNYGFESENDTAIIRVHQRPIAVIDFSPPTLPWNTGSHCSCTGMVSMMGRSWNMSGGRVWTDS